LHREPPGRRAGAGRPHPAVARVLKSTDARQLVPPAARQRASDPAWDAARFRTIREFALAVPEIVHLTVMTPYPGTEIWHTESRRLTTRDYGLFDIQHAVVPTTLPLAEFYRELVRTRP
jgi:hopanoid C-3 methylase